MNFNAIDWLADIFNGKNAELRKNNKILNNKLQQSTHSFEIVAKTKRILNAYDNALVMRCNENVYERE